MFTRLMRSRMTKVVLTLLVVAMVLSVAQIAFAQTTAPAPTAEAGRTGFGLFAYIFDWVVKAILAACSIAVVAWAIDAIMHIRESKVLPVETVEHLRSLIQSRQFEELMTFTSTDQSFVSQSLNAGLRRAHLGYPAMREALQVSAGEQTAGWFRRIEMLNVVGNVGPLLGLLGTVLGMIDAFDALSKAGGSPEPGKLANGIAMALNHTFFGLMVAIPALITFGWYRLRVDKICMKATVLGEELLESLRPAEKGGMPAAARPAPRRASSPEAAETA